MYTPPAFREDRPEVLHAMIRNHPLGMLVTNGPSGLIADLVPFILSANDGSPALHAHLARANGQLANLRQQTEALVVFQGPQAYVTPSWYPAKAEHGKVVPTWNYVVVQIHGTARVIDDEAWLRDHLDTLTAMRERDRAAPWHVGDAPHAFIAGQIKGIVGVEIPVERIAGKWKVSHNRDAADRRGVAEGLRAEGIAPAMAAIVAGY